MEMASVDCQRKDNQRTDYVANRFTNHEIRWWNNLKISIGRRVVENLTWDELLEKMKEQLYTTRPV